MQEFESEDFGVNPPFVGDRAPDFANITAYYKGEFKKVSLSDYKGSWLILFFYPRDFTFICPTEIQEFGQYHEQFKALNCNILAASTDSEWSHKQWFETDDRLKATPFPILADTTQEVADVYRVLDDEGAAQRGTFIIDPHGMMQYILVSAGSVGRSTAEILRVVEALQTGERCPANWHVGEQTLGK